MHRHRALILVFGALLLTGCQDLDRQILSLASWLMLFTLMWQALLTLVAERSPLESGWRTFGMVLAMFTTFVGIFFALGAASIYAGRPAWELASTLDMAFVLYGAAALVGMTARVATWNTPDEAVRRVSFGMPAQSNTFRDVSIGAAVLASVALTVLLVR